jgi:hypothetical protein
MLNVAFGNWASSWRGGETLNVGVFTRRKMLLLCAAFYQMRWDAPKHDMLWREIADGRDPEPGFDPKHNAILWVGAFLKEDHPLLADVVRDTFGDPFHPMELPAHTAECENCNGYGGQRRPCASHPSGHLVECRACGSTGGVPAPCLWLTPTVKGLARAAWDHVTPAGSLDSARLAVLSDALEEAGCVGEKCKECNGGGTYTVQATNAGLSAANGYGAATTYSEWRGCRHCGGDYNRKGTGRKPQPILAALRSPGTKWRGFDALDVVLGTR